METISKSKNRFIIFLNECLIISFKERVILKKIVFTFFIFIVSLSFLVGCNNDNINKEDFPYSYIHADFSYAPFTIPDHWDVVSIQSNVQLRHQDWDNPENHMYAETPYRYTFTFGKRADENSVTEEQLEEFNKQQELKGETSRQLYYHTYYEHYATLQISTSGFLRLASDFEEAEEWEISGEDMLVLRKGNDWVVNWYKNGKYYDLLLTSEVGIDTEIKFEETINGLFF